MSIERQIWDRGEEGNENSYLKEMLLHPWNSLAFLGALSTAALVSIPFGLGLGALPLLAFGAGEAIAILFIPSSGRFRAWVDERARRARRERARAHLIRELRERIGDAHSSWDAYARMRERLSSLEEVVEGGRTSLSELDVERLDDATVSYLGLWLALVLIDERKDTVDDANVAQALEDLEHQIAEAKSAVERRRFEQAKEDLLRIQRRREGLVSQEASVRAGLLSMVDTFEEVYQQVVTDPTSSEATRHLQDAVDRLQIEERLDVGVDDELADLFRGRRASKSEASPVKTSSGDAAKEKAKAEAKAASAARRSAASKANTQKTSGQ